MLTPLSLTRTHRLPEIFVHIMYVFVSSHVTFQHESFAIALPTLRCQDAKKFSFASLCVFAALREVNEKA